MSDERFEIGLTMAGAISAGAYTAGVIDFLVEALDAWDAAKTAARAGGPPVPLHAVSLRVMSGASAGAIVAAILAANIDRRWDPVRSANAAAADVANPLYQSWVNEVDIRPLLGCGDLADDALPVSLLDATVLDGIAKKALSFMGPGVLRDWVADPLRAIFTLTNLTGVPYQYGMRGNTATGQDRTMHGDLIRFAVLGAGTPCDHPPRTGANASYEYPLPPMPQASAKWSDKEWARFAMMSVSSGAFPLGLRPRTVTRNASDYAGIPVLVPGDPPSWQPSYPAWQTVPGQQVTFLAVDGGCIDNEPLELAREELARSSVDGRNPRGGLEARRAVLMIDPFVGPSDPGPAQVADNPLHKAFFSLLGAYTDNSRFKSADITLASQPDNYSRFMVAPRRPNPPLKLAELARRGYTDAEGTWLASGALGGFSGFFHRDFRQHDFLLGRRNCQWFLANHFTLPAGNPLFDTWRNDTGLVAQFRADAPPGVAPELPIVPLVGSLHPRNGAQEPVPEWPQDRFAGADIREALGERLDGVVAKYNARLGWFTRGLVWAAWKAFARGMALDAAEKALDAALVKQGLLKPQGKNGG